MRGKHVAARAAQFEALRTEDHGDCDKAPVWEQGLKVLEENVLKFCAASIDYE